MPELSVVIITRNEEANILRCIQSVKLADEIIVIDSGSTDRTIEIAKNNGAEVYSKSWAGYGPAKQEGVNRANGEWILSLDADEILTSELAKEITETINNAYSYSGYHVKRKTNFLGKWIYHCGWYPDYILRLFKKSDGNFDNSLVHEKVVVNGKTGYLNGELLHYCYNNLEQYFDKFNAYTTMGAEKALEQGKRIGLFGFIVKPPVTFFKHYIFKLGFLDGIEGLMISALSAAAVFVKYAKLRELVRRGVTKKVKNV